MSIDVLVNDLLREGRPEDPPGLTVPPLLGLIPLLESSVLLRLGGSVLMYVELPLDLDRCGLGGEGERDTGGDTTVSGRSVGTNGFA